MSDIIELHAGERPWMPTKDSEQVVLLDEYNVPLAGILSQQGHTYLYVCAAGEESPSGIWLYTLLEEAEVVALDAARGRAVRDVMMESLQHKTVVAALADDWNLALWDQFDSTDEKPGVMVRRFLRRLEARMRRYGDNINRLDHDPSLDMQGELEVCV